ncbi:MULTISPECIES: extracellular solute-binding protein [unclassified Microbacterium]|uniref:ABC transporter substrate-binding protein n=1 Tax=unclassified Microbacterium TaxID=2609290 RepID=UPI00214B376A|nr:MULTISPECIES: extracellular solute-binding protein [unclassified Microbacterium]MCR2783759.1 extracellular solute-binding protein [Microbacterium sp. zg.B96]WIM17644.1 extracellular solute-binding protein [Microbacterium sp. zg-B96]
MHKTLRPIVLLGVTSVALALAACAPPGGSAAPSASAAPNGGEAATCGDEDVVLKGYFETGFPLPSALAEEFTRQYPNVTFDIREDQFAIITQNAPRVLQDSPPDLMRLPQMSELATDGLLLDLDPYAEGFGWTDWPQSQLTQLRVDEEGRRGSGPLYAQGLNYSMTGVFFNKELAAQIGMDEAPATLEEFDAALQAAKDAGIVPIAQFNGGATGGLAFPLQGLMASYGDPAAINEWIFQQPGATIDTPENLAAAEHLQSWIDAGFFAEDINSMDYAQMMSRFIGGESLFMFNGDWESGNLDAQMAGNAGFFLVPPVEEGGQIGAMSAPLTFGVAAAAENPDCAAFFLDWTATNEDARALTVEVGGSHPMGPADAFMPAIEEGSTTDETLAAGSIMGEANGGMDFIANATGAIYAQSWTPNLQKMVAGEQTPAGLLESVQADYESQVGN